MRRSAFVLILFLLGSIVSAAAQAVESADARKFTINVGAMGSLFDPHDNGKSVYYAPQNLQIGLGTYVDLHFTHWVQLEGEARWDRFNGYAGDHQDMYLIGPRVPIHQLGRRSEIYGKALIGLGKMTFPNNYGYGTFTALAFGGGIDYKLSPKLTLRPVDLEYQDWPKWLANGSISPYGVSVGLSYRVF